MGWDEESDEAAFYGPEDRRAVIDPRGREETLSSVQVDLHFPEVFDLEFQTSSGEGQRPVIIHRSLISTMERLVAHLIEQYDGAFPVGLAPVQLAVLPVNDRHIQAAADLRDTALAAGGTVAPRHRDRGELEPQTPDALCSLIADLAVRRARGSERP